MLLKPIRYLKQSQKMHELLYIVLHMYNTLIISIIEIGVLIGGISLLYYVYNWILFSMKILVVILQTRLLISLY